VQACANTGSVADEKSTIVQARAGSSSGLAGSLRDASSAESEIRPKLPLRSVRQVAALLGAWRLHPNWPSFQGAGHKN
jgi:hypothetical protein